VPGRQTFESGENCKEKAKTKPAKVEPNDLQLRDEPPSPQELGEISGGRKSNDPCEGRQECEVMKVYTLEQIFQETINPLALDLFCSDPIYCLVSLTLVCFVTGEGLCTELASSSVTPISLLFRG
jgi:hypothetical protein